MYPYCRILGFIDQNRYFFQVAPQLYFEAEWALFQTHYFSENLLMPDSLFVCLFVHDFGNYYTSSIFYMEKRKFMNSYC
jgi:hypothetical protein